MLKILVTETLEKYVQNLQNILPSADIWINVASSTEEMLEIHRYEDFDLLILELDTPQMGGDTLCTTIRENSTLKDVSIILVSPDREDAKDRCVSCGANYIITEPVSQNALISKVNDLIKVPDRKNLRVLMNITVNGEENDHFYSTSRNISSSGILLETNRQLDINTSLHFSFLLKMKRINVNGEVVRSEQKAPNLYYYGIRFTDIDPASKAFIDDFVKIR